MPLNLVKIKHNILFFKTTIMQKIISLFCVFLIISVNLIAQNQKNIHFEKIAIEGSTLEWMEVKSEQNLDVNTLVKEQKKALNLQENDALELTKVEIDQLDWGHYDYQQTYKGIRVEGAKYKLHTQNDRVKKGNGQLVENINVDVNTTFSSEEAIEIALVDCAAQKYAWEDNVHQEFLGLDDTSGPEVTLVLYDPTYSNNGANYRLAYKIDVYSIEPYARYYAYVDAHTGKLFDKMTQIIECNSPGTALTNYHGVTSITTDAFNGSYRLHDCTRGQGIETYQITSIAGNSVAIADVIENDGNNDNNWTSNDLITKTACEGHKGAELTYDYFYETHSRDSYDDAGAILRSLVNYGNVSNAFWTGNFMVYGNGDGSNYGPMTALDIIAHELAHAITQYTAALVYRYESGALNESFSDIFGTLVEFAKDPNGGDWSIGEDAHLIGTGLRDMADPNSKNQPMAYEGLHWWDQIACSAGQNNDYCGVHFNSGVQNHWFYLLVTGGSGTNEFGTNYSVSSIGLDAAAAIVYRNLTVYLTPTSNYADARQGSIQAAEDIYGIGSNEVQQVINAWCAVNVGGCVVPSKDITVTAPNGGEFFLYNDPVDIIWNWTGAITDVHIEYSIDNGVTWSTVVANTTNDGTYTWSAPNATTNIALIRITDIGDNSIYDSSDDVFAIQGCSSNASFTTYHSTCINDCSSFINTSTGAISFAWYIDGNLIVENLDYNNSNYTHCFTSPGTYIVELFATDITGCTDSYNTTITIDPYPNAAFTYNISGLVATFSANQNIANFNYEWGIGPTGSPIQVGSGQTFAYTFPNTGTYDVCLTTYNNCPAPNNLAVSCQTIVVSGNNVVPFTKGYGAGSISDIIEMPDGNYLVAKGSLLKVDITGAIIWEQQYAGLNITRITPKGNGNYLVAGGDKLAEVDAQGNLVWMQIYDFSVSSMTTNHIQVLNNGDILLTGKLDNVVCIIKIDASGNLIWTKTYGTLSSYKTFEDASGNLVLFAGSSLLNLDANGNVIDEHVFYFPELLDVIQLADGNFLMYGHTTILDAYIVKVSSTGTVFWNNYYNDGSGTMNHTPLYGVVEQSNGDLVFGGRTGAFNVANPYALYLLKTDANGNFIESKTYKNTAFSTDFPYTFIQTSDGGFIYGGDFDRDYALDNTSATYESFLLKIDDNLEANCSTNDVTTVVVNETPTFPTIGGRTATIYTGGFNFPTTTTVITLTNTCEDLCATNPITFQKVYGSGFISDIIYDVVEATNGDYFAIGHRGTASSIRKIDINGDIVWKLDISNVRLHTVIATNDGNYITVGDDYAIKFDVNGNVIWDHQYETLSSYALRINNIVELSDGNLVLLGDFWNGSSNLLAVVSLAANGTVNWSYDYGIGSAVDLVENPSGETDWLLLIQQNNSSFIHMLYMDNDGSVVQEIVNEVLDVGCGSGGIFEAKDMVLTDDGNVVIAGNWLCGTLYSSLVMKIEPFLTLGFPTWIKSYTHFNGEFENIEQLILLPTGDFLISGNTLNAGDTYIRKINNNGEEIWTKYYNALDFVHEYSNAFIPTSDGGILIGGYASDGTSIDKGFLLKTDALGYTDCQPVYDTSPTVTDLAANTGYNPTIASNLYNVITGAGALAGFNMIPETCEDVCGPSTSCPIASFSKPNTPICDSYTFINNSTNATSYTWKIDGVIVGNSTDLTYTFLQGIYLVELEASNANCTETFAAVVEVIGTGLTFPEIPDVLDCSITSTTLDAGPNMTFYEWTLDGNLVGSSQTINITQSGTYTLYAEYECGNINNQDVEVILADGDCVWPGDFNSDGVCNAYDLIALGLMFGTYGIDRPDQSIDWSPHACLDWGGQQINGVDHKHIDCNGDGVLDISDLQCIIENYGNTHTSSSIVPTLTDINAGAYTTSSPFRLYFDVGSTPSFTSSTDNKLVLNINIESDLGMGVVAYGLVFDINYLSSIGDLENPVLDFGTSSWIGTPDVDMLTIQQDFPNAGVIEAGVTRIDHIHRVGKGKIAELAIEVDIENIPSWDSVTVVFNIGQVFAFNDGGDIDSTSLGYGVTPVYAEPFSITLYPRDIEVSLNAILDGAYDESIGEMRTDLNTLGLLPLTQPYNTAPYNYTGTETLTSIPSGMVDWVLVEARSGTPNMSGSRNTVTIETKAGILLKNGAIVATDGASPLTFENLNTGEDYYFCVRHRNHLDILTSNPYTADASTPIFHDFTIDQNQALGNFQMTLTNDGKAALYAGDFVPDGVIQISDFNAWRANPAMVNVYDASDATLDGIVQATDFDIWSPNKAVLGIVEIAY